ncbi:LacI family DNA-binding transcriptional regulator [Microbacterium sp. G2-8]|uniref:LacI family DNA-binding transcriptional regulator n=1 Tax=Microbacterium sp. G2-8 TaxID=2842454 RepID=UPI0021AA2E58|nr:LacI family DNA-binding transcriptional regulator [Microbacterium sp. G2-8]
MTRTRPPSMADVASAAGVSHQTVSRVLNGHAHVRAETRERVLTAIEELGYRRNQAARTLVTTQSATIGIVTTATTNFGPASTVLAIEESARAAGYFVSLAALGSHDPEDTGRVLDQLMNQGVDGIIVLAPIVEVASLLDGVLLPVPIVVVAAREDAPAGTSVRYVAVDQRAGAALAARHLAGLGHERVVHVAGPRNWYDAIERVRGFADVFADGRILDATGWDAQSGYDAGARLARDVVDGTVTAVFAANDYLALGIIRAFWERGIRVPDEVSIAGFDGIDGSGFLVPSLTTVRQSFAALGDAAVRGLLDPTASGADPILPELVVRGSTTPPP